MARAKILLLDSDLSWSLAVSEALMAQNHEVLSAVKPEDALLFLEAQNVQILIAECAAGPAMDGFAFLEQVRQVHSPVSVIVCTSRPSVAQAVAATKLGVVDYREKSIEPTAVAALCELVGNVARERDRDLAVVHAPAPEQRGLLAASSQGFYGIVSQNSQMRDIFELIQTIADSYANVLICGETGTGKELVARAIHGASNRHGKPLVTMDCSALARELLESELFGHEKGAFTGASDRHIGRFERANGGTLFLDEVANISLNVQAKLLRVLQSRTFERVGGQQSISVDVRIVAASNRPLEELIAEGAFREDLYHRLNVVEINLPPLRARIEDIPLLAGEFLRRFARQNGRDVRDFTSEALSILTAYRWPGNVRELENVVLQAVVLAKSPYIDSADLPRRITQPADIAAQSPRLAAQLEEPEKQILLNALRQHGGNIKRTAAELDISRTTLYAKLKKYAINLETLR